MVAVAATFHRELPFIPDTIVVCPPAMLKVSDPILHTSFQWSKTSPSLNALFYMYTPFYTPQCMKTLEDILFLYLKRRNKHLIFTSLHVNAGFV